MNVKLFSLVVGVHVDAMAFFQETLVLFLRRVFTRGTIACVFRPTSLTGRR